MSTPTPPGGAGGSADQPQSHAKPIEKFKPRD